MVVYGYRVGDKVGVYSKKHPAAAETNSIALKQKRRNSCPAGVESAKSEMNPPYFVPG